VVVLTTDTYEQVLDTPAADPPSAALTADGSRVAVAESGKVQIYGLPGKRPLLAVNIPQLPTVVVQALAPAGNLLVVRDGAGGRIRTAVPVIDLVTRRSRSLSGNYAAAAPVFSADGRFLAAALGPTVEVWDTATWEKAAVAAARAAVTAVALGPDGRKLAAAAA